MRVLVLLLVMSILATTGTVALSEERFRQEQVDRWHQAEVLSLAWAPAGSPALATGGALGQIWVWFPGLRLPGYSLQVGEEKSMQSLAWSTDGTFLLAVGNSAEEGWIYRWDVPSRTLVLTHHISDSTLSCISSHPKDRLFAVGAGNEIQLWRLEERDYYQKLTGLGSVTSLAWNGMGSVLASSWSSGSTGEVRLWSAPDYTLLSSFGDRPYSSLAWNEDGSKLALGRMDGIEVWDLATSTSTVFATSIAISTVSWSSTGILAAGEIGGDVNLFSPDGVLLQRISRHSTWVTALAWEPQEEVLASSSLDGTTRTFLRKSATFPDIRGHWAEDFIDSLVDRGAVNGFPDNTFRPDSLLTRAQFVKTLLLALGLKPEGHASSAPFADVPFDHWASDYIATAQNRGLVEGYPDGSFQPERFVSRAEVVAVVARALGWGGEQNLSPVLPSDIQDSWARTYIAAFFLHGALSMADSFFFTQEGNFQPSLKVTRGETCLLVERALRKSQPLL